MTMPPQATIPGSYRVAARLRRWSALPLLSLGAALLTVSPLSHLEHSWGLESLYALRGPRPAPPRVIVIALHGAAARTLGVPARPDRWPRALHAELLERLHEHGARVVAFDLLFDRERSADDDARLQQALRRTGKGVLVAYLHRDTQTAGAAVANVDQWVAPLPALSDAALATAAFALVKSNEGVLSYLAFAPEGDDHPSLPLVLAAQSEPAAWQPLTAALPHPPSRPHAALEALRRLARSQPGALASTEPEPALTEQWRRILSQPDNEIFLNMYGPPGHMRTLGYDLALKLLREGGEGALGFKDATVLVGSSEFNQAEQRDVYRTPWSTREGLDVSGVELGATAVANQLDGSILHPLAPGPSAGLLAMLAAMCLLPWRVWPTRWALPAWGALAAIYAGIACAIFGQLHVWMPWALPLGVVWPLSGLVGLGWRLRDVEQQRQRLRLALSRYGPRDEVSRLARTLRNADDTVHVACLCTDIENYTQRIEALDPAQARDWLNAYFETVFPIVRAHGGHVVDHAGDSMVCIWLSVHDPQTTCRQAVNAARALHAALNQEGGVGPTRRPCRTRLGLHFGPVALGEVGDAQHAEQRVVGDIVNTASRIQSANKLLGTRVLVSDTVAGHLPTTECRPLGRFLLTGKQVPVGLADPLSTDHALRSEHAQALGAWEAGDLRTARTALATLLSRWPDDGPARFLSDRIAAAKDECVESASEGPPSCAAPPSGDRRVIRLHLK